MEEERGAHSIWSEHHRVVRRIDRRSLPRRIVGAAASFFVCSARESMIEVVRASGSALRQTKCNANSQRRRRGQRAASSSVRHSGAARCASRAPRLRRLQHTWSASSASQLPLAHRHVKPPVFAAAQIFLLRLRLRRVRRRGSEQR